MIQKLELTTLYLINFNTNDCYDFTVSLKTLKIKIYYFIPVPVTKLQRSTLVSRICFVPSNNRATAACSTAPSTTPTPGSACPPKATASTTGSSTRTEPFLATRINAIVSFKFLSYKKVCCICRKELYVLFYRIGVCIVKSICVCVLIPIYESGQQSFKDNIRMCRASKIVENFKK